MVRNRKRRIHRVSCSMQVLELTKARSSMSFEISAHGTKIGEIILGRGSFIWYSKHGRKPTRFSWSKFAEVMDSYARSGRRAK